MGLGLLFQKSADKGVAVTPMQGMIQQADKKGAFKETPAGLFSQLMGNRSGRIFEEDEEDTSLRRRSILE